MVSPPSTGKFGAFRDCDPIFRGITPAPDPLHNPTRVRRIGEKNEPTTAVSLCHHEHDESIGPALRRRAMNYSASFGGRWLMFPAINPPVLNTPAPLQVCTHMQRLSTDLARDERGSRKLGRLAIPA